METKHEVNHTLFVKNENLDNIYNVTYNDYSYDDVTEYLEGSEPNNPNDNATGCSGVRYGNYFGRSFDYYYLDVPSFLITTPSKNGRYASIGISGGDFSLSIDRIKRINENKKTEKDILDEKLLPLCMIDGINENGVAISGNVVPSHDFVPHENEEEYVTHSTNPGKKDLHIQFLIRYVLDYAKSARHAIELLQNVNITGLNSKGQLRDYLGLYNMGYELHYMIADKYDNYIIEFVNDRMSIISGNVMTNFYLSMLTNSSAGLERFQILEQNCKNVKTLDDMKSLIESVKYSDTFRTDLGYMARPTELSSPDLPYYKTKKYLEEHWDEYKEILDNMYEIIQNGQKSPTTGVDVPWISSHAEVFDLENKTLNICTQENYDNWQVYSFNK